MASVHIAYLLCLVILIAYICKYQYELRLYTYRKHQAKNAKLASAKALMLSRNTQNPDAKYFAELSAFMSNQADTANTYEETIYYSDLAQDYAEQSMKMI